MGTSLFAIGKAAFALAGVLVGWQLAREVRRGEGLGLHQVALAAILTGGLGLVSMPVAEALASPGLMLAGEIAVRIAMLLLCAFVAGTFRRSPLGVAAATLCGLLMVATLAWDVVIQPNLVHYDYSLASSHASQLAIALPLAWSSLESAAHRRMAIRRLKLGLEQPGVAEMFLLWSLATACLVGIMLLAVAAGALEAVAPGWVDAVHGLRGALYLVVAALVGRAVLSRADTARPRPALTQR